MSPMLLLLKSTKIYSNTFFLEIASCKPFKSWRPCLVPNTPWLLSHGEKFNMGGETKSLTYNILRGAMWNWLNVFLRTVPPSTLFLTHTASDIYLLTWLCFILTFYDPWNHKQKARQKIFKHYTENKSELCRKAGIILFYFSRNHRCEACQLTMTIGPDNAALYNLQTQHQMHFHHHVLFHCWANHQTFSFFHFRNTKLNSATAKQCISDVKVCE
jgi:hypothetical protein